MNKGDRRGESKFQTRGEWGVCISHGSNAVKTRGDGY